MTEPTPRQSARAPSVEDIRVSASPMPVYDAAGDACRTCIRVCPGASARALWTAAGTGRDLDRVDGVHGRVFCDARLHA
jgi:hypothetical protein